MEFLNPAIAIGNNKIEYKFELLSEKYNINLNDLLLEWRTLEFNFSQDEIKSFKKMNVLEFWCKLIKTKNFNDNLVFSNLLTLVEIIFALPHANADAERIFSIITDVRTKKRNKLSHTLLNSVCIIRSFLQNENINCNDFKCNPNHFKHLNYKSLYPKND